ncbi:MAG: tetratricopeptide repeat protein [Bacteroidales bacterium]|nr:tetratricopeptide repeat protein [Bacteroidales bacterium]
MKGLLLFVFCFYALEEVFSNYNTFPDSNEVKKLIKLTVNYTGIDNFKALENVNKAIELSEKIEYIAGIAESYYKRAILYYYMAEYKKAEQDLHKVFEYRTKLKDSKGLADVYQMRGIILDAYYQHDQAIEIFFKAIDLYKKINDKDGLSAAYGNIAISYTILNDYDNSIKYQRKSLEYAFQLKDYESVAISYYEIAVCYEKMNALDKALMFLDSAEYFHNIAGKLSGKAAVLNSKGIVFKKLKQYDKALNLINEAILINTKLNQRQDLSLNFLNKGEIMILTGNYLEAIRYLTDVIRISQEIANYDVLANAYKFLSRAYKQLNLFDKSLEYYEKYDALKDTTTIDDAKKRMLMLQAYYNDKQKENEIVILNQQNKLKEVHIKRQRYLLFFSTIVFIFLATIAYLWYKRYKEKKALNAILEKQYLKIQEQKDEIENQKKSIEVQAQQLKELNEYKTRFYENISHEFRTPLTLILSPLEQLINNEKDVNIVGLYQIMHRNALRLKNQIDNILQLTKIESNEIKLNLQQIDLCEFIPGIINNFEYEIQQKNLHIEFVTDLKQCFFMADIEKLETIFFNLIGNAIRHNNSGCRIKISLFGNDNVLLISVKDNGQGIDKNLMPFIFDRFKPHVFETSGFGLGLNIVKELIELHNGKISVTSEYGQGTEFIIELPQCGKKDELLLDIAQIYDNEEKLLISEGDCSERFSVLIVEDNKDMLNYLHCQLSTCFDVKIASNGKEALEKAYKYYPDCIVADIMMPVMDGYEMTKNLKNDILISHIPVILLTAKTSEHSIIKGLDTDADEYLTKPFKINELISRIKSMIRNRQRLRENFEKNNLIIPSEISVTCKDKKFLSDAVKTIEENMISSEFDVNIFCSKMGMSRANMHRKIKALTNMSTTEFIKSIRLKRAAQLIEQNAGTISEIAYSVGFDNLSYFTRCFKDFFKIAPSEFKK